MGLRPFDVASNVVQPYKLNSIIRRMKRVNGVLHDQRTQIIPPSRVVPTGPWTRHEGHFEYDGSGGDNVLTLWPQIRKLDSTVDALAFAADLFEAGNAALTVDLIQYNPTTDAVVVVESESSPGTSAGAHRVEWEHESGDPPTLSSWLYYLRVTPATAGDLVYSGALTTALDQDGNPIPGMSKSYSRSSTLGADDLNDLQDAVIDHEDKIRGERWVPLGLGDVQIVQGCEVVGGRRLRTTTTSPIADLYIREPRGARIAEWVMYVSDQDGATITASLQELNPKTGGVSTLTTASTSSGTSGATTLSKDIAQFVRPDRVYRLRFSGDASQQQLRGAEILVDQPPSHP